MDQIVRGGRRRRRVQVICGAVVLVALGWGAGFVLIRDSVAVPHQDLLPWMWGSGGTPPRSVPQDALVAVVDNAVPGWLVQRAMLVAGLLLLGFGVARLLRARPGFEQGAAAIVAVSSTYVFERSLMGHWGLLLGLAALPWVIDAASDVRQARSGALPRLLAWALVGSVVPTAGALQVAAAALVLLWPPPTRLQAAAAGFGGVLAWQLVWIIPGLQTISAGSADAADVFGLRAEGVAGPVLTALGTGGIWNSAVMPDSRLGFMSILAPAVLLILAGLGAPSLRSLPGNVLGPLLLLAGAGFGWALLTALGGAAAWVAQVEALPGGGLLRDAHKWLAPWVVLLAMSAGMGLGRLRERLRGSDAWWPGSVLLLLIPIMLLPDLVMGPWGRIRPVDYPPEWASVRSYLAASARPGDVVSLPWSTFRSYEWNGNRTMLDPAARYLPRTVVTDSRLLVQRADGLVVVPSDDPRSVDVGRALLAESPASGLLDLGIGWVLWQDGQPATPGFPSQPPAWLTTQGTNVVEGEDLTLIELVGEPGEPGNRQDAPLRLAWAGWLMVLFWVSVGLLRHWRRRRTAISHLPSRGSGTVRNDE